MSESRSRTEARNKIFVLKSYSNPTVKRAQVQQLQKELDSLALLLDQVIKQTDRVAAAADAIGDALIGDLEMGRSGRQALTQENESSLSEDDSESQGNCGVGIANKSRRIAAGVRFAN